MKQQKLDSRVFNLASNLFGYGTTAEKLALQNEIAISNAADLTLDSRIMAVYPAIVDEAYSITMDNYRKHVAAYNTRTADENSLIAKHNTSVKSYRKKTELTEVQKKFSLIFELKHNSLPPRKYNELADAFCKDYGLIVEKKKIQTVKYATEIIFSNLLHLYNSQLMKRNTRYMSLRVTEKRPLQEFKVNSFLVTELKRNNHRSLDLCSKTVRNHRQRLQECGVFIDYHFAGQNRPVELHINPEILAVFDLKTNKLAIAENQRLNLNFGKVLPDNNDITGTCLNEYQKKENAGSSLDIRSSLALTPFYVSFTGTPASKDGNSTEGGAAENVKVSETLSEKLLDQILHPQELAERLAAKEFNSYRPIDIRYLYKEAYSGTLTNDEFRELAIQDFFKSISKLWKKSTPYAGSWKKAINLYSQSKWIAFTGASFTKANIVEDIQQMRWRTEWARKWFIKNEFPPLFPFEYFDMTRKTSKEVGFEYTLRKWNEHEAAKQKYEAVKKKLQADSIRRRTAINYSKKCETAVARFLKDKITLPQLFDYVEKNLPAEFLAKLPQIIEKKSVIAGPSGAKESFAAYGVHEF
ncbi:hypothetical protein MH928_17390 [Flavobacterium sp. WW92]|uniref:hypothetical protein n=1 Tax=unclassified Flavobacterium TaxID=196869 RepID=UPI0022243136|nr:MULTISPECIES: hypothetical protein [unclassified Flavobacterium]WDO13083.1 hypothetical protein MH928_17390 [Flavobacterium sp. WW92]